jgi:phosphotransferase system  glucose/maltose/N-acetylglucosamine-specific IIC component
MNEFDLERYKAAWKGEPRFGRQALSTPEIEAVLQRESRTVTRQFRTGLLVDIVLKSVSAAALAGLLFLFRGNTAVSIMNTVVLAFTLFLLFLQWGTLQDVPRPRVAAESLKSGLETMIRFYRERFLRALYVAAVSGSLVFYIGVLYYSWFKYAGIRPLDTDDYIVFISGLLLAFAINAVAQRWQAAFHVRELEACLQEMDAETLSRQHLRKQRHRRTRVTLMWAVWAVLGILVLAYFLAR